MAKHCGGTNGTTRGPIEKLPALAAKRLRLKLRLHPDIRRDAAKVASIKTLSKADLLDLADKLGIDVHAIVDDVVQNGRGLESIWEEQDVERHNYSTKYPAFKVPWSSISHSSSTASG